MWYVLYCPNQDEAQMIHSCRQHLSKQALKDAFTFTFDRLRRYEGAWHLESRPMFPGYIFLETEDGELLTEELEQYRRIVRILGSGETPVSVQEEEEALLRAVSDAKHHTGLSRGYILNGNTHVTEGPLMGKESLIRKIDRHKRLARLELPKEPQFQTAGRPKEMWLGLEIVSKS